MLQNFITKLSPQEKKIFYITVVAVLLALFDRLFLGPVSSRLKQLDKEIEQENNVIKRNLRFLSYRDRILQENESFSDYLPQKDQTEEEIIAGFLKKIEILATDAKINLVKVSPNESQKKKGYIEYYADVECNGPLEQIVAFIHSIDSSDDLVKIVKAVILPQRASASEVSSTLVVKKILISAESSEEAKRIEEEFKKTTPEATESGSLTSMDKTKTSENKKEGTEEKSSGSPTEVSGPVVTLEASSKETSSSSKEISPPASQGTSMSKSQRYQMSGGKQSEKEPAPSKKKNEEEEAPLKESIFEKILGKTGKGKATDENPEDAENSQ